MELPTFQRITTTVSDNNEQYLLHFSTAIVITNCVSFIDLAKVFNVQNCTCGVFGRKLVLFRVS